MQVERGMDENSKFPSTDQVSYFVFYQEVGAHGASGSGVFKLPKGLLETGVLSGNQIRINAVNINTREGIYNSSELSRNVIDCV